MKIITYLIFYHVLNILETMQDKELSQYDRDNELKTSEPAGEEKR
jgi:hypothetical protein